MVISQCSELKMLGECRAKARGWSRAESALSNRTQEPLLGEGVSSARRHHPKRSVTCPNKHVTRGTLIQLSAPRPAQSQMDVVMGKDTHMHTGGRGRLCTHRHPHQRCT